MDRLTIDETEEVFLGCYRSNVVRGDCLNS